MPARTPAVAFVSAAPSSTADDLLAKLVAFRPIEVKTIETKIGPSDATICQIVEINQDGTASDLGERMIFWQIVRRQLLAATPGTPWVVGRLVQSGQAYRLDAITDAETPLVRQALLAVTK